MARSTLSLIATPQRVRIAIPDDDPPSHPETVHPDNIFYVSAKPKIVFASAAKVVMYVNSPKA